MAGLEVDGRAVGISPGDTVGSALYRAGVRTFTRSLKYHRRRGLYCLSGDCANCLVTVDAEPGVRACTAEARDGQLVVRETGWPSTEIDVLALADRAHALMPVGFYYKTFIRSRRAWELAERLIRRATGVGTLPAGGSTDRKAIGHLAVDVLVIGGGVAGLAAAAEAAASGASVIVCDEGRLGEKVSSPASLDRIRKLEAALRAHEDATILERHTAIGVYEGPLVPLVGDDAVLRVDPGRVVVATGAVEAHAVFPGNDLPGVFLGRGAARLAARHHVQPGARVVAAATTAEGMEQLRTLRDAGAELVAAVVPAAMADGVPAGVATIADGAVVAAEGTRSVRAAVVEGRGRRTGIDCDTLVLSVGYAPRDGLLRMAHGLPVVGAGDVVDPGCSVDEAEEGGRAAGRGRRPPARRPSEPAIRSGGFVCPCEDVGVRELRQAWAEGFRSSEILKRYTTATMGPCQGALCGGILARFASGATSATNGGSSGDRTEPGDRTAAADGPAVDAPVASRTTSRPPARGARLEDLATGVDEVIERRTALHARHLAMGARLDWSGSWKRPYHYGDAHAEYRAVREGVGVMDVGTLGKFLVGGRDAGALVDRVFAGRVEDLVPGRSRYALALDEAGYVLDDGLVCRLEGDRYYLTSTSGGADRMEAWLRNWADRWEMRAHVVNQTSMLGAINVAGPRARDLLSMLCDDALDRDSFPYPSHREVTVAGVPCRAIRVGFVGELSFELHHARRRGPELWTALLEAGERFGVRPHGLDALDVLRLEKGHPYVGQDTLPDDHPGKLGLGWAVAMDKPSFLGKRSLQRMGELPLERKLVGLEFDAPAPRRGEPLIAADGVVGRITSSAHAPSLGRTIGLGWVRAVDGVVPEGLRTAASARARVVPTPFYDTRGERVRA